MSIARQVGSLLCATMPDDTFGPTILRIRDIILPLESYFGLPRLNFTCTKIALVTLCHGVY